MSLTFIGEDERVTFYDRMRMDAVNHILANLMNSVYDDAEFQESVSKLDDDEKLDIDETVYFLLKHLPITEGEILQKEYTRLKEQVKEYEDMIEDLEFQLKEIRNPSQVIPSPNHESVLK